MHDYLDFWDYIVIVLTSIIKTMIIFLIANFVVHLGMYNHSLGEIIANSMNIPHDLALTINSLGFVNNIAVIFTVIELILIGSIIYQLNKYRLMNRIFSYFCDFMSI